MATLQYDTQTRAIAEHTAQVWRDATGKKATLSGETTAFITFKDDARRFRRKGRTAVEERSGTRKAVNDLTEAELLAHPKWRQYCAYTLHAEVIPTYTEKTARWATFEWTTSHLAWFGIQTETFTSLHTATDGKVHASSFTNTRILYSNEKTADTPNPLPFAPTTSAFTAPFPMKDATPAFRDIYNRERDRQTTLRGGPPTDPDLSAYFQRGTHLTYRTYLTTTRTGGRTSTKTKETGKHEPRHWVGDAILLTDFSTKAKAKAIDSTPDRRIPLPYERHQRDLRLALEEVRRQRGELKRELAEAVFHPDRVDRMARAGGIEFEDYLSRLDGEA